MNTSLRKNPRKRKFDVTESDRRGAAVMHRKENRQRRRPRDHAEAEPMENMSAWLGLRNLTGVEMPTRGILREVRTWHRKKALTLLAMVAFELTERAGGVRSSEVQQLAYQALSEPVEGDSEFEKALAQALLAQPSRRQLVHEQGVLTLQQLVLSESADEGREPNLRQLFFWLLCLSDHLKMPDFSGERAEFVGAIAFANLFNQTSDSSLEFLCRTNAIFVAPVAALAVSEGEWTALQEATFGALVEDYIQLFAAPMTVLNEGFGFQKQPSHSLKTWCAGRGGAFMRRWFEQASLSLESWRGHLELESEEPSLPPLCPEFFRHPMVYDAEGVLILAPSLMRAHLLIGIWGRLNQAAKQLDPQDDGGRFRTAMGQRFESWAQHLAVRARETKAFKDGVIVPDPSRPDHQGLPDLLFLHENRLVIVEVKVMLQPERKLKHADNVSAYTEWLQRLLFEPKTKKNPKGGALVQLDQVVERIRTGDYAHLGIRPGLIIAPVLLTLDALPNSHWFNGWVDENCETKGLLHARKDVRPTTVLGPSDFEKLLAFAKRNGGVSKLLFAKVSSQQRLRPFGYFLDDKRIVEHPHKDRLAVLDADFEALLAKTVGRLREVLGSEQGSES